LFVREHPERVAGLVWIDALTGAMLDRLPELYGLKRSACLAAAAAGFGVIRPIGPLGLTTGRGASAARSVALTYRRRTLDTVCSLTRSFRISADEIRAAPPMRSAIPAVILVHGEPRSSIFPGSSRDPVSQWLTSQDMSSAGNSRTWL
jgi:hypothetical protein